MTSNTRRHQNFREFAADHTTQPYRRQRKCNRNIRFRFAELAGEQTPDKLRLSGVISCARLKEGTAVSVNSFTVNNDLSTAKSETYVNEFCTPLITFSSQNPTVSDVPEHGMKPVGLDDGMTDWL